MIPTTNEELRMYYFTLRHLAGLHRGIQADHAQTEMWLKYANGMGNIEKHPREYGLLYEWASLHKTVIVLDGGTEAHLEMLQAFLNMNETGEECSNPGYPWAIFKEPDMHNCLTAVAVILPARVFNYMPEDPENDDYRQAGLTAWEAGFAQFKNKFQLAAS